MSVTFSSPVSTWQTVMEPCLCTQMAEVFTTALKISDAGQEFDEPMLAALSAEAMQTCPICKGSGVETALR